MNPGSARASILKQTEFAPEAPGLKRRGKRMYVFDSITSDFTFKEMARITMFIMVGAMSLAAIILPYRSVHLPTAFMLVVACILAVMCLKFALENFLLLIIVFTVYAPFSKMLPGDFGNLFRAFNVTNIIIIFMIFGWLSQNFLYARNIYTFRKLDVVVLLFMVLSVISMFLGDLLASQEAVAAQFHEPLIFVLKRWLTPFFIYFLILNNVRNEKDVKSILLAMGITILMVAVVCLKEYYIDKGGLWGSFSSYEKARIRGIADQPNQMSAFFCYYSFYFLAFFLGYFWSFSGWCWLTLFVMCFQSMQVCFSRGGQLGFYAGVLATLFLISKRLFLLVVGPLVLILMIDPGLLPQRFLGRLDRMVAPEEKFGEEVPMDARLDQNSKDRIRIWKAGLQMVKDSPLYGIGYGRFNVTIGQYDPVMSNRDAHNTYVIIAAEMGVPALIMFLSIIFSGMYFAWNVFRKTDSWFQRHFAIGFLGGSIGLLVSNVFGTRLDSSEITFYYWILLAIVLRCSEMADAKKAAAAAGAAPRAGIS